MSNVLSKRDGVCVCGGGYRRETEIGGETVSHKIKLHRVRQRHLERKRYRQTDRRTGGQTVRRTDRHTDGREGGGVIE